MYNFTDSQFMSASDKKAFIKAWEKFLKSGLKKSNFSKRIYNHLHLHCGFIAHYNIQDFYEERFEDLNGRRTTFNQLISCNSTYEHSDYRDVNSEMRKILLNYLPSLNSSANSQEIVEIEKTQKILSSRLAQLKNI